jgi:hypothetical protein
MTHQFIQSQRFIVLTFTLPGFHHYPQAPEAVGFLRDRHRHLFRFVLRFRVQHDNRDKEFFLVSSEVQNFLTGIYGNPAEFGAASCEELAQGLLTEYAAQGCCWVEVWEDAENGAIAAL